jgi:hypothetical protein
MIPKSWTDGIQKAYKFEHGLFFAWVCFTHFPPRFAENFTLITITDESLGVVYVAKSVNKIKKTKGEWELWYFTYIYIGGEGEHVHCLGLREH